MSNIHKTSVRVVRIPIERRRTWMTLIVTSRKHREPNFKLLKKPSKCKGTLSPPPPTLPLAVPPATPMRNGFLLTAAAADPLGDALSGEDVCDGLRTMLSIVIEIPGSWIRFRERRRKWRADAITADEVATMRVGLRQVIFSAGRPVFVGVGGSASACGKAAGRSSSRTRYCYLARRWRR